MKIQHLCLRSFLSCKVKVTCGAREGIFNRNEAVILVTFTAVNTTKEGVCVHVLDPTHSTDTPFKVPVPPDSNTDVFDHCTISTTDPARVGRVA
jgi:hypothetical protein